jgi:N-acetylneuraminic acid mutarotase
MNLVFPERENEYDGEHETMTCFREMYNSWKLLRQDAIMSVTPRIAHATAAFRIQSSNSREAGDSNLLLVIHGGYSFDYEHGTAGLSSKTDFFDIDTEMWISLEVKVGSITDLAVGYHTAVSFLDLPGSPVVIYGGILDSHGATECIPNVRILMSEFHDNESQNHLVWKEGMPGPRRCGHAAVAVGSIMVVFGGSTSFSKIINSMDSTSSKLGHATNDIYIYSTVNDSWTKARPFGAIPAPRCHAAIAALNDECIFVVGGKVWVMGVDTVSTDLYVYNITRNKWTYLSDLPAPWRLNRGNLYAFLSKSGDSRNLVAMRFHRFRGNVYAVYRFNLTKPTHGRWTFVDAELNNPYPQNKIEFSFTAVNFKGRERAYQFGGIPIMHANSQFRLETLSRVSSELSYITGTSTCYFWTAVSPVARSPGRVCGHTMTLLDNSIFVFGGFIKEVLKGIEQALPDVWRIDPANTAKTWQQYRSLLDNKRTFVGHTTVAVSHVTCLLTYGGYTLDEYSEWIDGNILFVCPQRFIWRQFPYVKEIAPPGRMYHTSVVYKDKMYVFGGINMTRPINFLNVLGDFWYLSIDSVISYSTSSGGNVEWKQLHSNNERPSARMGHSALPITDNTGMILFGGTNGQSVLDDVWIYTYSSNEWERLETSSSSILESEASVGRYGHAAVVMGHHLIVHGGCTLPPSKLDVDWQHLPPCLSEGRSRATMYFDITMKTWRVLEVMNSLSLLFHKAVLWRKEIVIFGGLKANDMPSDQMLTFRPSCNPGMRGSLIGLGCNDCPKGMYSENSGPECTYCNNFFTTSQTGSRSFNDCNICYGVCSNGGLCIVTIPNFRYECRCPALFTGPTCGNIGPALGVASGITGGLILFYLIVRIVKYCRRVKEDAIRIRDRDVYIGDFIEGGRIAERELTLGQRLGMGAFGEVRLAEYREIQVAVKILHHGPNRPIMGSDAGELFEQEIDFMRRTRHENIVLFLGWGVTSAGGLFLVTEYVRRGSLNNVLQECRNSLTLDRQIQFARDTAEGMRYLHSKGRIHRDLKAPNLLVSGNWMVKVADFGSARTLCNLETATNAQARDYDRNEEDSDDYSETSLLTTNYLSMTHQVGTVLYSAPEVLSHEAYGAAVDVYSFGIVMWEIYVRRPPFEGQHIPQFYDDLVDMICMQRVRPVIPADCPPQWTALMTQCWSGDSHARPVFREIVRRLDEMRADL